MNAPLKTVLLGLILAAVGLATPLCSNGNTLADYLPGGSITECQAGQVIFSNFARTSSGNAGVPEDVWVNFSSSGSSAGIVFAATWGAEGGGGGNSLNDLISFTVTIAFPGGMFTDVSLEARGAGTAASNQVAESVNGVAVLTWHPFPADLTSYSESVAIAPQASLNIAKTVHLGEGRNKWGLLTEIGQVFTFGGGAPPAEVPEPGTFALVGLTLSCFGLLRRRQRRF